MADSINRKFSVSAAALARTWLRITSGTAKKRQKFRLSKNREPRNQLVETFVWYGKRKQPYKTKENKGKQTMSVKTKTTGETSVSTKTINIHFNIDPISQTIGSVRWLQSQKIELNFREVNWDNLTFRAADLSVNGGSTTIATHGAYWDEETPVWIPKQGYHRIELALDSPYNQDLVFGAPLTPAAVRLLEQVADRGREMFQLWIEDETVLDIDFIC